MRRGDKGVRGEVAVQAMLLRRGVLGMGARMPGVMRAEPSSGVGGERGEPPDVEDRDDDVVDSVSQACTEMGAVTLRLVTAG